MPYATVDLPYYIIEATMPDSSQYSITLKVIVEQGPFTGTTTDQVATGLRDFLAGRPNVSANLVKINQTTVAL